MSKGCPITSEKQSISVPLPFSEGDWIPRDIVTPCFCCPFSPFRKKPAENPVAFLDRQVPKGHGSMAALRLVVMVRKPPGSCKRWGWEELLGGSKYVFGARFPGTQDHAVPEMLSNIEHNGL